jgi:peptidyl-prolyl cis-trans isomerase A (cyclophilin A)
MAEAKQTENPVVCISTSAGDVWAEIFVDKAPVSADNFLAYVREDFYDGLIFHRVIPRFMVQGGGFDKDMKQKSAKAPIKNEAGNGLKNLTGTLALARTNVVDSATSQFFINAADNDFLDHRNNSPDGFGYAVFGRVTNGMEVVQKIEKVRTGSRGLHQDVPVEPVVIRSITISS